MPELFSEDFPINFAGALLNRMIDFGLEYYWSTNPEGLSGTFPYIGMDPLPPLDDLLTVGIAGAQYVVGRYTKRDTLQKLGEGGLCSQVPMYVKHTLARLTPGYISQAERTPAPVAVRRVGARPAVPPLYGERVGTAPVLRNHVRYVTT